MQTRGASYWKGRGPMVDHFDLDKPSGVHGQGLELRRCLWALGCIIYQMLAGETPFNAASEYLIFQRILHRDLRFPEDFHSSALKLVDSLLATEPGARPGGDPEGLEELRRHPLFGGSERAFQALCDQDPPTRVHSQNRHREGAHDHAASLEATFDFATSAECTPEVGQNFLVDRASRMEVIDLKGTSRCSGTPKHEKVATPRGGTRSWSRMGVLPFSSFQLWLCELTRRRILARGEDVALCGTVIQRRFPCLKPKILLLTSSPRLLVLNSRGLSVLQEVDLLEHQVSVESPIHFQLKTPRRTYRCCDMHVGADAWLTKVGAASEQVALRQG